MSSDNEHFPQIYLSDVEDLDLPDEGSMTIKFKLRRESEDKKTGRCTYDVDVISIEDITASGAKRKTSEYGKRGDNLDKLREESDEKE